MPQPFFQPPRNAHRAVLGYTGLSFVIYDLRHTFATRFYQTTKDVVALKEVLGHSSLRTVMKYVHVSAEQSGERPHPAHAEKPLRYCSWRSGDGGRKTGRFPLLLTTL
jgi:integrase